MIFNDTAYYLNKSFFMEGSYMSKSLFQKLLIQTIVLFLFTFLCNSVWAEPRIRFDDKIFDFGSVIQGKPLVHEFEFQNIGDKLLTIKGVRAG